MYGSEYFAGLLSEERTEEMHAGHLVPIFVHPDGAARNEPLDTAAYALAARRNHKGDIEEARAELERQAEESKTEAKPKPRPRSNWVVLSG